MRADPAAHVAARTAAHIAARTAARLFLAASLLAASGAQAACPGDRVEIETSGGGVIAFAVEIADTPDERARGLMFRTDLAQDAGMLFLFDGAQERAFWMENTPLSLDMLFIGDDGRICGMVERAAPFTRDPRRSGCAARAVLEINGGLAQALGLTVGARLRHAAFGEDAAWPCSVARPPANG